MARVPQMSFVPPAPPTAESWRVAATRDETPAERARKRFSIEGKRAIGKPPSCSVIWMKNNFGFPLPTILPSLPVKSAAHKITQVTGGARGLGLTIAEGFLEHGLTKLALFDIDAKELELASNQLQQYYAQDTTTKPIITFHVVDVTEAKQLNEAVRDVAEKFDGIDILVTFAGIVDSVRALDYTPDVFRRLLDVNTTGTFLTAQAVAR
jgi:hypothetical protein